jgi:ribosomal subunit interface protein
VEIVVKGRNVEVPEHYRVHVSDKLARLERYDNKVIRFDVELYHEPNRRQAKSCQRVEITGKGRGPVIRGEGCAADFYLALDLAVCRLEARLRRAHDRRRVHHGRHGLTSVAQATASGATDAPIAANGSAMHGAAMNGSGMNGSGRNGSGMNGSGMNGTAAAVLTRLRDDVPAQREPADDTISHSADDSADHDPYGPGRIARTKQHPAEPMTVDQALYHMELVGHDFYLFADAVSGRPSVVYRRRGFDYGMITLR